MHSRENIDQIIKWYKGEKPYVFFYPKEEEKEKRFDIQKNAVMTYINSETKFARYATSLWLKTDCFKGKKVADLGSGPLPTLALFSGCERYCVDHLLNRYRALGYPLEEYEPEINFINAKTERLPFPDKYLDVVISRNAIDHVDNLKRSVAEILRVLKPDGALHLLVNYHEPTSTEPRALNDEIILKYLGKLNPRKIYEEDGSWGFPGGKTALWSTLNENSIHQSQLDFSYDEVVAVIRGFSEILKRNHDVRHTYLFGSLAWNKPGVYKHIYLAIVLSFPDGLKDPRITYADIVEKARRLNPLLEVTCFKDSEFFGNHPEPAVVQILRDGIEIKA